MDMDMDMVVVMRMEKAGKWDEIEEVDEWD